MWMGLGLQVGPQPLWCQNWANWLLVMPFRKRGPARRAYCHEQHLCFADRLRPKRVSETNRMAIIMSLQDERNIWPLGQKRKREGGRHLVYPCWAGVLPGSGWNWQNCRCSSSYPRQSRRHMWQNRPRWRKSCNHFSHEDGNTEECSCSCCHWRPLDS